MTEKKQTYRQLKRKSGESYQVLGAMQNGKADTVAAKNNIMQLRLREAMRQDVMNEKNQLDALMEAIPVGIAILDEKGGRVKSNKEFEKIWGGSCPSVDSIEDYSKYKAWWVDTGKPVKSEEWASAQAVLKGKTVIEQLLEIERFDGTRAFVINSAAPIFDSAGKITGSAVVIQDITEIRRAEDVLRRSREDLDRAQAVGNIGSWRLNVQKNELIWSDENHRIFGVPKGKPMTYEFFLSTIHPDDRQYVDEKWKAALAGEPYDIEHRIIVNGKVKWVREKAYLEFGSNGLLQGGFGTTQDITQRKLAEEEIANIAKFPEENPYPVLRITSEGTITYSNTPGCVLLKQWKCKVGEKVPKHWQEMIAKVMNSKACSVEEIQCSDLIFTLSITPVVDLGYVNIYGQDITKRKKAEEELYHTNQMLEQRVQERTAELAETVSVLQEEVRQRITAENAARSERQKFNDVLDTLPAYVCLLTPDYRMPFANRVFREWFGYESDKKCYEFLFNRTEPCEICETFKVFEDNKPHRWEWTGPNGRNYDIFDFPFEDTDGSQLILEMGIDVTERKRNEQLLERQAEELWEKAELLDLAHDSIVVHDLDGKITFWSRGAESIYGYSRQEALGNNSHELLKTEFSQPLLKIISSVSAYGKWEGELIHTTKTGKKITVESRWALKKDVDGQPFGVLQIDRDITRRKQAERQREQARIYAASIIETIQESLIVLGPKLKVISANKAFYELFDLSPEEVEGKYIYEVDQNQWDIPDLRKLLEEILPLNSSFEDYEMEFRNAAGGRRVLQLNARSIHRQKKADMILLAIQDITVRKMQEAELQELTEKLLLAEEEQRQEAATALHDSIGQVLAFSKRHLSTVLKETDGKTRDSLEQVRDNISEAIRQTRELTSDLSSPTVHTFGLQAGIEELAEEFSEEHNIECRFHGTEDKKILEKNVRLLFYRSVKELLCNIAKHADANSVDINIDSDGEYFRVVVADDGKGFDVAEWSSSGKDKGFGLYSIKQRLTNVRGSFSIVSEKEKGTKVVLEAPLNDDRTHGRR